MSAAKKAMSQDHDGVEIVDLSKLSLEEIEEVRNKANQRISKAIVYLLQNEAFYGNILTSLKRDQSINLPTMGVWYHNGFNLAYNPFFVDTLNNLELVSVLKHELFHIIFNHIHRREQKDAVTWNYGTDFAINSIIEGIPESGLFPDKQPYNLPKGESADWYYQRLIQDPEIQKDIQKKAGKFKGNNKSKGGGGDGEGHQSPEEAEQRDSNEDWQNAGEIKIGGGTGNHDWSDNTIDSDLIESDAKRLLREAYDSLTSDQKNNNRAWGNTPANIIKEIEDFIYSESKVPWGQLMRRFVMFVKNISRQPYRLRPNRRYGWVIPGSKTRELISLAVIFDTSGSVSDYEFVEFSNELNHLLKVVDKIEVIHCDTSPVHIGEYKRHQKPPGRRGYGGTEFSEAIRMAEDLKPDGIVYLTDLECHFNFKPTRYPMLWVSTTDHVAPKEHGITVKMELPEENRRW